MKDPEATARIIVFASGRFGAVIANELAKSNEPVYLWYAEASRVKDFAQTGTYLEEGYEYPLSKKIRPVTGFKEISEGAWSVWIALQSPVMESVLEQILNRLDRNQSHTLFFLSRGLVSRKIRRRYSIYTYSEFANVQAQSNGFKDLATVSFNGPSLLGEIKQGRFAFLTAASADQNRIALAKTQLHKTKIYIEASSDPRGVEICGVLKNPIAVAAGMVSTLPDSGDNVMGEILSIAWKDFLALGGKLQIARETLFGRAGLADLITTAISGHSRNRSYGQHFVHRLFSSDEKPNLIQRVELLLNPGGFIEREVKEGSYLAEGVFALSVINEVAEELGVEVPFYSLLYRILARREPPESLLTLCGIPESDRSGISLATPRKQGLHFTAGSSLQAVLEKRVVASVTGGSGLYGRIVRQSRQVINNLERRLKELGKGDRKEISTIHEELARWERFHTGDEASQLANLQSIIHFYVSEISDRYQPGVREALLRMLTPVRGVLGGFRRGSAVPHIGGFVDDIKRYAKTYNIFYAPTHKTHLDSLEVAFGLNSLGLPVPRYAAARSLMSNPFRSWMLKSMGAYAVDRNRTRNILYLECLTQYSTMMLEAGIPTLVFPEGGRSRSGAMTPIKTGLLSTAVDAYRNTGSEIIIAPITLSYERVPEDLQFTGIASEVSFNEFLTNRHGVYLDFGEPIRVSEHIQGDSPALSIAYRISSIWEKSLKILPNHLIARLLIENNLVLEKEQLPSLVEDFLISHPGNYLLREPGEIVQKGVALLKERDLIREDGAKITGRNRILLNYYGNMIPGILDSQISDEGD